MSRRFLLALPLAAAASVAHADPVLIYRWDGALRIFQQSPQCDGQFVSPDNDRAIYYLRLDEFASLPTLTRFGKSETEMIDIQGNNYYKSDKIAKASFSYYFSQYRNLTQTPAVVTATTNFISLTVTLDNYNDIFGCTIKMQGSFVRVAPDEAPPVY